MGSLESLLPLNLPPPPQEDHRGFRYSTGGGDGGAGRAVFGLGGITYCIILSEPPGRKPCGLMDGGDLSQIWNGCARISGQGEQETTSLSLNLPATSLGCRWSLPKKPCAYLGFLLAPNVIPHNPRDRGDGDRNRGSCRVFLRLSSS